MSAGMAFRCTLVASLFVATAGAAHGAEAQDSKKQLSSKLSTNKVLLTPDARTEVVLSSMEMEVFADGRRVLRGKASPSQQSEGREAFFYVVDPAARTYRTFALQGEPLDDPDL